MWYSPRNASLRIFHISRGYLIPQTLQTYTYTKRGTIMFHISQSEVRLKSHMLLQELYGVDATFRHGQWEAVALCLSHKRSLIVQQSGWGKSFVYLVATKLRRERGQAPTLVITSSQRPKTFAQQMGLSYMQLTPPPQSPSFISQVTEGTKQGVDLFFLHPDHVSFSEISTLLEHTPPFGSLILDNMEQLSDLSHNFSFSYRSCLSWLKKHPTLPVAGFTAYAPPPVYADLQKQLGTDVALSFGSMARKNLEIHALPSWDKPTRFAWICEKLHKLDGTGVIYCKTQKDCEDFSAYLTKLRISNLCYPFSSPKDRHPQLLQPFYQNNIKVLVLTFDVATILEKEAVSFLFFNDCPHCFMHFVQLTHSVTSQASPTHCYILPAHTHWETLWKGHPTFHDYNQIYQMITHCVSSEISLTQLLQTVNLSYHFIEQILSFLINEGFIEELPSKQHTYRATTLPFIHVQDPIAYRFAVKRQDCQNMIGFLDVKSCFNHKIQQILGDATATVCGSCGNCKRNLNLAHPPHDDNVALLTSHFQTALYPLPPRTFFITTPTKESSVIPPHKQNKPGYCLSLYGETGYGEWVRKDKFKNIRYRQDLVEKTADIILNYYPTDKIQAISYVPSLRSDLVKIWAEDVGKRLDMPVITLLKKEPVPTQRDMLNQCFRLNNPQTAYSYRPSSISYHDIILLDDVMETQWTLAVCGGLLRETGIENIYPFVLADRTDSVY